MVPDGGVTPDMAPADMGPPMSVDAPPLIEDAPPLGEETGTAAPRFCELGSDVAGATVPGGFCLRKYADVKVARGLVFGPNGDLFVAAPSAGTAGGASGGPGAIVVLTDDNHDGVAEVSNFAEGLMDVHGLTLGDGYLYYTTQQSVFRTAYVMGQRHEDISKRQDLGLPSSFGNGGRWTHGLAHSVGGNLYASRGSTAAAAATTAARSRGWGWASCPWSPTGSATRCTCAATTRTTPAPPPSWARTARRSQGEAGRPAHSPRATTATPAATARASPSPPPRPAPAPG
jgi:glucose/arabinose dehydrogenase